MIVCLIGCYDFIESFQLWSTVEAKAGNTVLTPNIWDRNMNSKECEQLLVLHTKNIGLADKIFVLNVEVPCCSNCGKRVFPQYGMVGKEIHSECCVYAHTVIKPYIDRDTKSKIALANILKKPIIYLHGESK